MASGQAAMVEQPDASKSVVGDGEPAVPIYREAVRASGTTGEVQVDPDLSDGPVRPERDTVHGVGPRDGDVERILGWTKRETIRTGNALSQQFKTAGRMPAEDTADGAPQIRLPLVGEVYRAILTYDNIAEAQERLVPEAGYERRQLQVSAKSQQTAFVIGDKERAVGTSRHAVRSSAIVEVKLHPAMTVDPQDPAVREVRDVEGAVGTETRPLKK